MTGFHRLGWLGTHSVAQAGSCLSLPSTWIVGINHHAWKINFELL
jgi:hypothetical protein